MLRDPSNQEKMSISIDDLPEIATTPWHTLHCELVTPMYGGGVVSATVDNKMPIRAMSIRGALRFWWRLLAKHKWRLDDIRKAETNLWGGMNSGGDEGKASKVLLKIDKMPTVHKDKLIKYDDRLLRNLKYALFTAYNDKDKEQKPQAHQLLNSEGITWEMSFAFLPTTSEEQKQQVIETLQWWANFGGLGFRSRKGLGAVHVSGCPDYPQICEILSDKEVALANCQLVQKQEATTNPLAALETAVQKLSNFRQQAGVGRNEPSEQARRENKPAGRSRWPEPDALRRIQKNLQFDPRHQPEHKAGNIFPRAVFGLPILFHSYQEKAVNATVEPSIGERLASPLLLRPTYAGKDSKGNKLWKATALVLPYKDILQMKVVLNNNTYPIWQADKATDIKPIADNGGGDPLQAFLHYFAQ